MIVSDNWTENDKRGDPRMNLPHRRGLDYIAPGKLQQKSFRRKLHGRFRDECSNDDVCANLAKARAVFERWLIDYNYVRPHSAYEGLTPKAARLEPAAVRLRNLISSAARPLPPTQQIGYPPPGLSQ